MFSNAKGRAPRIQILNKSKACKIMQPWLFVGCWEAGVPFPFHLAREVSLSFLLTNNSPKLSDLQTRVLCTSTLWLE